MAGRANSSRQRAPSLCGFSAASFRHQLAAAGKHKQPVALSSQPEGAFMGYLQPGKWDIGATFEEICDTISNAIGYDL